MTAYEQAVRTIEHALVSNERLNFMQDLSIDQLHILVRTALDALLAATQEQSTEPLALLGPVHYYDEAEHADGCPAERPLAKCDCLTVRVPIYRPAEDGL